MEAGIRQDNGRTAEGAVASGNLAGTESVSITDSEAQGREHGAAGEAGGVSHATR